MLTEGLEKPKQLIPILKLSSSCILSLLEELHLTSIQLFIKDSTNPDSTDTLSHSQGLPKHSLKTKLQYHKDKLNSTPEFLLLLDLSPTILDSWTYLKDLEYVLLDSPMKLDKELLPLRDNAWLSINWLKLPQQVKTYSWSEVQEIEKLKDISVSIQDREDLIQLQESDLKEDILKELEEEDDNNDLFTYLKH